MDKIKNWSLVLLLTISIVFGYFLFKKKEIKQVKVPIVMEVPVPGKLGTFEPRLLPKPKTVKPKPKLVEEFQEATLERKDSLYADAVTERSYQEIFADSTQSITVRSNVQGKLLNQSLEYEIYPTTVILDTTLLVDIPTKIKPEFFLMVGIGANFLEMNNAYKPVGQVSAFYKSPKKRYWSLTIDSNKNALLGTSIKF